MNPFGIAFTNPALWFGAFALALPLGIHLLTRKTPVRVVFPTLEFLRRAQAEQSRLYKIRHLLLLILRTLIVLLILGTFLKPVYQKGALIEGIDPDSAAAVILVLDTSLSMGYSGGALSPFAKGQIAAEKILSHLKGEDIANLILAGAEPVPAFPKPTRNRQALRREIQEKNSTLERSDFDAAVAMAVEQISQIKGFRKEIHFVSDFQRTSWSAVQFAAVPEDVRLVFVEVGEPQAGNSAITEILLKPPQPAVGEEVEILCKIANYSGAPENLPIRLVFDGEDEELRRNLSLDPGRTETVGFRIRARRPGLLEGRVFLPEDRLNADNSRYFTLPITERIPITILSNRDPDDLAAPHRFLRAALAPFESSGKFAVKLLSPDSFGLVETTEAPIVILAGPGPVSQKTAESLVSHLENGGSVIYFLSGHPDKANLDLMRATSPNGILWPYHLGALLEHRPGDEREFTALSEANYDEPMLRKFRDAGDLASVHFFRRFTTRREENVGTILLRYDDGHIALARAPVGLGSLLLANFSPDLEGGDLPQHPVFIPLAHEMVQAMRPREGSQRRFTIGHPCAATVPLDPPEIPIRFVSPVGESISAGIARGEKEASIIFGKTSFPGFYRILKQDELLGSVAVNVDSRESNLQTLSVDQIEKASRVSGDRIFSSQGPDAASLRQLREGLPLWNYLLLLGLGGLLIEQFIYLVWRR